MKANPDEPVIDKTGGSGTAIVIHDGGRKLFRSLALLLLFAGGGAAAQFVAVLREPQRWILVTESWMGSFAVQRTMHVLFGAGPAIWIGFWLMLGLGLDSLFLRKTRNRSFRLDRLSFLAIWLSAYLLSSVALFRLMHGHWTGRLLIISPYMSPPMLASRFLDGHWLSGLLLLVPYVSVPVSVAVAAPVHSISVILMSGRRQQKPSPAFLLISWSLACLVAAAVSLLWPLQNPSATNTGWIIVALVTLVALTVALVWLKTFRLEHLLERISSNMLQKPSRPALLFAGVLGAAFASGMLSSAKAETRSERPNVILITLDTLRADHMGSYGYNLKTTPKLDVFGEQSTIFTNCASTAPYTAPAVWSMMTSTYRTVHSVGVPGKPKIIPDQETLAKILSRNGYLTAAFVSNSVLHRKRRFWQGFRIYDDTYTSFPLSRGVIERTAEKTNEYVFGFLDAIGERRFFLWVHYQDPHGPYIPPERYLRRIPERMSRDDQKVLPVTDNDGRNGIPMYQYIPGHNSPADYRIRYNGEIAYADDLIGDLLEQLKKRGLWDKSVVIFTADHGEAMGEHGYYFCHGHDLTEDLIHVPLIMHVPGMDHVQKVDELVSIIDLAPTVLAAAGLEDELKGAGMNLLPLIEGRERRLDREHIIAEDLSNRICFRSREMKYIAGPDGERLYDLSVDPDESINILADSPELAAHWRAIHEDYLCREEQRSETSPRYAPRDVENLRSLGYIK